MWIFQKDEEFKLKDKWNEILRESIRSSLSQSNLSEDYPRSDDEDWDETKFKMSEDDILEDIQLEETSKLVKDEPKDCEPKNHP